MLFRKSRLCEGGPVTTVRCLPGGAEMEGLMFWALAYLVVGLGLAILVTTLGAELCCHHN